MTTKTKAMLGSDLVAKVPEAELDISKTLFYHTRDGVVYFTNAEGREKQSTVNWYGTILPQVLDALEGADAAPAAHDPVNRPSHYTQGGIECIDAIEAALGPEGFAAYCRGNVIKYTWRAGLKDAAAQDARKAEWYARRLAESQERAA